MSRYVEDSGLRILTWRDSTELVLDYFLTVRNLVFDATDPRSSPRETGIPILDSYIETLARLGGRTGILIARRI